jgi:hypothetical protein
LIILDKNDLINKFNNFENKIKDNTFQQNKGLGNDVGYYIFDYPTEYEEYIRIRVKKIKDKINDNNYPFKIQEFDIYNIVFDIIKEKNYLEKIFQLEEKRGTKKTLQAIQSMLKLGTDNNLISKKILEEYDKNTVIFITGIGKIYPIVRAHDILNNLDITEVPLVLFYPGKYTGTDLKLFNEIEDTNYYRALSFEKI